MARKKSEDGEDVGLAPPELVNAWILVGRFFYNWGHMEEVLNQGIRRFFDLPDVEGEIIIANLGFREKTNILRSSLDLYLRDGPHESATIALETVRRLEKISEEWRNVLAHTAFVGLPDHSVKFLRSKARGKLDFPVMIKPQIEMMLICVEIGELQDRFQEHIEHVLQQTLFDPEDEEEI